MAEEEGLPPEDLERVRQMRYGDSYDRRVRTLEKAKAKSRSSRGGALSGSGTLKDRNGEKCIVM